VLVDYKALVEDKEVCMALPDLSNQLREQPETTLNCLGLAIHQVHIHIRFIEFSCVYVF
jgi:hypothetical protein